MKSQALFLCALLVLSHTASCGFVPRGVDLSFNIVDYVQTLATRPEIVRLNQNAHMNAACWNETSTTMTETSETETNIAEVDLTNTFYKNCKNNRLDEQVTCFVNQHGEPLTAARADKFDKIAAGPYSKLFVRQRYAARYLPASKLDKYLPRYFSLYRGPTKNKWNDVAKEIRECKNGFVFKWWNTEPLDHDEKLFFRHHAQFFAADCRNKDKIVVIVFNGSRKGFYRPKAYTDQNRAWVKKYAKDTLLHIINKHFGK